MKLLKNIFGIIIICVGLFLIDRQASWYGNGIIHLYKHLNYHISLTKINQHYFLYGDLGYIAPQETYDKLYIEKIIGYQNNEEELKIYVSANKKIKSLSFYNERMVMDKKPIIKEEINIPNNIINLKDVPIVYYYWKVFFVVGLLICSVLFINLLYKIYKVNDN